METMLLNTEDIKTNVPHKFVVHWLERLELRSSDKHVALQNMPIYYLWKNIKKLYRNNELKIISPTWNDEFELHNDSYSVLDMQDYSMYDETLSTNPPIHICINSINNKLVFKMKDGLS